MAGYAYILASKRNGTLYVGVTSDLVRRVYAHREGLLEGFTKEYGVRARESAQEMEPRLETAAGRGGEPAVE